VVVCSKRSHECERGTQSACATVYTQSIVRWIVGFLFVSCALAQTTENAPEPVGDAVLGQQRFESQCALCHGQDGSGGRGPNLRRPKLEHAPDDAALRKVIAEGIQPEMPGAWQLSPHEVASVAAYVRKIGAVPQEPVPGDAARGEQIYKSKGCANCHMIRGIGSGFAPELSDIGTRRSVSYLRESIVAPEASVPDRFLMIEAVTASGQTVRGLRANEDTFTIQIKTAKGEFLSFRKADLKELRKLRGKSPMPSYQGALTPEELTDLTAYLAGLKGRS
jgi:cytochrome c oxidase cbb3-type subunit 3